MDPDTGATQHMTNDFRNLSTHSEPYKGPDQIYVGDGSGFPVSHSGTSVLHSPSHSYILSDILVSPRLNQNLLSVSHFASDNSVFFEFHKSCFFVKDYLGNTLLRGTVKDGLYQFQSPPQPTPFKALSAISTSTLKWHQRLGHCSPPVLRLALNKMSLVIPNKAPPVVCAPCQLAKSHRLPLYTSAFTSSSPLDLIYSDVWGHCTESSIYGNRYYVSFLDDFTKYLWLFPIKLKSDVATIFPDFLTQVERQFNTKLKAIQIDWGGEYRHFKYTLRQLGIQHRVSCPHTHEQVGAVERRHRQVVEIGLSLLAHSNLPLPYWEDAFVTATYLINRLPTPVLHNKSPFELVYHRLHEYSFLRVFGCACWTYLRPYNHHKTDFRSATCIFLGYSPSHHGYKCLDLSSGRTYIARHVVFDENVFPYIPSPLASTSPTPSAPLPTLIPQQTTTTPPPTHTPTI